MLTEMEIVIKQVVPTDAQVLKLIGKLDAYQISLYGIEQCNLESPESLNNHDAYMLGAYSGEQLAGIGGVKLMDGYAEIKRMYVEEDFRGLLIAERIVARLEAYAMQQGVSRICLETGNLHQSALHFYKKLGYRVIESFGNYRPNDVSVYFEKLANTIS